MFYIGIRIPAKARYTEEMLMERLEIDWSNVWTSADRDTAEAAICPVNGWDG
jgi:hypothetical protein